MASCLFVVINLLGAQNKLILHIFTMTSQEKFEILTAYHGELERRKWKLVQTDYKAIKHGEGVEEESAEDKAQRQEWRNEINQYQEWIKEIEATVPVDPEPEPMPEPEEIPAE